MAAFEVIALDTATPQLRAPGASDTYTFPRAVEMPLGTANGVLFLNGSKVVTSGSGLTFDGISALSVTASGGTPYVSFNRGGGDFLNIGQDSTGAFYNTAATNTHRWLLSGGVSEAMRLTSTGLGIGTTSPGANLQIGAASSGSQVVALAYSATSAGSIDFRANGSAFGAGWIQHDAASGAMRFATTGAERMRLDSSGNLGLGVTPSAWTIAAVQSQLGVFAGQSEFNTASNAYFDGAWKYFANGYASRYSHASGSHFWFNSGPVSGTAGNAISFTQAMTLDASGNLGIGSTSPIAYSGYVGITVQATNGGIINLRNGTLSNQMEIAVESGGSTGYVKTVTASPLILGANNAEMLRVKPTGQLRYAPLSSDPAGAEAGDVYYNSSTNKLRVYNGTAWVDLH